MSKRIEDIVVGDVITDKGGIDCMVMETPPLSGDFYPDHFRTIDCHGDNIGLEGLVGPDEITHINGQRVATVIDKSGTTISVSSQEPDSFSDEGFEKLEYHIVGSLPETSAIFGDAYCSGLAIMHEQSAIERAELEAHAVNELLDAMNSTRDPDVTAAWIIKKMEAAK